LEEVLAALGGGSYSTWRRFLQHLEEVLAALGGGSCSTLRGISGLLG